MAFIDQLSGASNASPETYNPDNADYQDDLLVSRLLAKPAPSAELAMPSAYDMRTSTGGKVFDWFTATGVVAATSLIDAPAALSNTLFGTNYRLTPMDRAVRQYAGRDASQFYQQNEDLVNMSGFIGGSLIPGLGGVKLLQAGQAAAKAELAAGRLPEPALWTLGLVADKTEDAAQVARQAMIAGNGSLQLGTASRAVVTQNLLESAAFETAVLATMQANPVLQDMTWKEQLENSLWGAGLGTAIGSAFGAAKIYGAVKKGREEGAALDNVFGYQAPDTADAGAGLLHHLMERNRLAVTDPASISSEAGSLARLEGARATSVAAHTNKATDIMVKQLGIDLALVDQVLARTADKTGEDLVGVTLGLTKVVRADQPAAEASMLAKLVKQKELTEEQAGSLVRYLDPVTGAVKQEKPVGYSLANKGAVEVGSLAQSRVTVGKQTIGVERNISLNFDVAAKSEEVVGSRYAFMAQHYKDKGLWFTKKGEQHAAYEHDIPVLTAGYKALQEGVLEKMLVRDSSGAVQAFTDPSKYKQWLGDHKIASRSRVTRAAFELKYTGDFEQMAKSIEFVTGKRVVPEDLKRRLNVDAYGAAYPRTVKNTVTGETRSFENTESWKTWLSQQGKDKLEFDLSDTAVAMNLRSLLKKDGTLDLQHTIRTLDHEYGHVRDNLVRKSNSDLYNAASPELRMAAMREAAILSAKARGPFKANDTYRNKPEELMADARQQLSMMTDEQRRKYPNLMNLLGTSLMVNSEQFRDFYRALKSEPEHIADFKLDMKESAVYGLADDAELFAADARFNQLAKVSDSKDAYANPYTVPTAYKLVYDKAMLQLADPGDVNSWRNLGVVQQLAESSNAMRIGAAREVLEDAVDAMPRAGTLANALAKFMQDKAGNFFASSNSEYGTFGSLTKFIGQQTSGLKTRALAKLAESYSPVQYALLNSDPQVAIGLELANSRFLQTGEKYVYDSASKSFVHKEAKQIRADLAQTEQQLAQAQAMQKQMLAGQQTAESAKAIADITDQAGKIAQQKRKLEAKLAELDNLTTGTGSKLELDIPLKSFVGGRDELVEKLELAVKWHIETNGKRLGKVDSMARATLGTEGRLARDADVFYPIPPEAGQFTHFAQVFVKGGSAELGHGTMIYAKSQQDLAAQIANAHTKFPGQLDIRTSTDIKQYKQARAEFDSDLAITERWVDSSMTRKGVTSEFTPLGDPKLIAEKFGNWHATKESSMVRKAVETMYYPVVKSLQQMSTDASALATAQKTRGFLASKWADDVDVFKQQLNQLMDISSKGQYKVWQDINNLVDVASDKVVNAYNRMKAKANIPTQEVLEDFGKQMELAGLRKGGVSGIEYALVNARVSQATASQAVSTLNGFLGLAALRSDVLNAINNTFGHQILVNTELRDMIEQLVAKNPNSNFAKLIKPAVPGGAGRMLSPGSLLKQAMQDVTTGANKAELQKLYSDLGFDIKLVGQFNEQLDNFAQQLGALEKGQASKITYQGTADTLEKYSGNKLAESFTRLVSARAAHLVAEEAVKSGILQPDVVYPFINTFVNRVHGTYVASQRPVMFQGPIGMAMGLFLTYQFNLMQQLTRYMSEGRNKTVAYMMGLQGSIYGLNGLPLFNAINTHIVGSAAGNDSNADFYSESYKAFGDNGADWFVYGLGSNLFGLIDEGLKTNLYTRGDINPRQITVVPTSFDEVAIFSGYSKLLTGMYNMAGNVVDAATGDENMASMASAVLRGIEHNGLSRPLAGFARVAEGFTNDESKAYSTDKLGRINYTWDMYSTASLTSMVGGKTLAEARTMDAVYRMKGYDALDNDRVKSIFNDVRRGIQAGNFDREQLFNLQSKYLELGHTRKQWNDAVIRLIKEADSTTAMEIAASNNEVRSQQVQYFMGGAVDNFGGLNGVREGIIANY